MTSKLRISLTYWKLGQQPSFRHRILKSIVSGPLDADKLDYLQRDSLHTGVTFGGDIDRGRLLRNLTICYASREGKLHVAEVGITEKALAVAESIWRARVEMFRANLLAPRSPFFEGYAHICC